MIFAGSSPVENISPEHTHTLNEDTIENVLIKNLINDKTVLSMYTYNSNTDLWLSTNSKTTELIKTIVKITMIHFEYIGRCKMETDL